MNNANTTTAERIAAMNLQNYGLLSSTIDAVTNKNIPVLKIIKKTLKPVVRPQMDKIIGRVA